MTDSLIVTRLQDESILNGNHVDSDASIIKSLSNELNEVSFRPQITVS